MSEYTVNVAPGTEVNVNVGFSPLCVVVSNYTPFYIYFPDAADFCPPWVTGAILSLSHANAARASWQVSPFYTDAQVLTPAPTGLKFAAALSYYDEAFPIQGGTVIPSPVPLVVNGYQYTLEPNIGNGYYDYWITDLLAGAHDGAYIDLYSIVGGADNTNSTLWQNIQMEARVLVSGMALFEAQVGPNRQSHQVVFNPPFACPNGSELVLSAFDIRQIAGDDTQVDFNIGYVVV